MTVASHANPSTHVRRLVTAVGCISLALLAAACSDDGDPDDDIGAPTEQDESTSTSTSTERSTSSTSSSTSTSSMPVTSGTGGASVAEQEVIDRYVGYWTARTAANTGVPDPGDPALAEYATGEQLSAVVAETQSNLDDGLAFRPAEQPAAFQEVRVVSITGDTAVVQECRVDDEVVYRRDTGEVVNDAVATHSVRGELVRIDGKWRLARAELVQRWEGVSGCALDG